MIFARRSRSDSAWPAIARFILSGKTTSLTSTAVTLIPHGSVCRSMISCSLRFIFALGEQFIEFRLSEHAAQRCLRNERRRFQVILRSHDCSRWIDDAKINHGINGHRHVVACHDFLARDVDSHDTQIHPHNAIDNRDQENHSRSFRGMMALVGRMKLSAIFKATIAASATLSRVVSGPRNRAA
jgi:hypothetical protein